MLNIPDWQGINDLKNKTNKSEKKNEEITHTEELPLA